MPSTGLPGWLAPVIAGVFTLVGVGATLFVNSRLQDKKKELDHKQQVHKDAREWSEKVLNAGTNIFKWVQRQETKTLRMPVREGTRHAADLADNLSSVFNGVDLYLPEESKPFADKYFQEAILLCLPVWNQNGYANKKSDFVEAERQLVNEIRRLGDLPPLSKPPVEFKTYAESRTAVNEMFGEGIRAHMEFLGFEREDIEEMLARAKASRKEGDVESEAGDME